MLLGVVWYKVVELGTRTEVVAGDALMSRYVEGCEVCSTGKGDYFKRVVVGRRRWRGQVCGVQSSSGQVRPSPERYRDESRRHTRSILSLHTYSREALSLAVLSR
jgi:hypothetical protein